MSTQSIFEYNATRSIVLLNKQKAAAWIEQLFQWLFATEERYRDAYYFQQEEEQLKQTLHCLLKSVDVSNVQEAIQLFFEALPALHQDLQADLDAVIEFDPAAKSRDEVILCYPGFFSVAVYRIAHFFWNQQIPVLPRLISEYAHGKTGIDIHPGAKIGSSFFIDHGTGVVIGETAVIGNDVKIYQGVTLGALSVSKDQATEKRHPTIEDGVVLYANATVLGGQTVIGKEAVIGGNVWVTSSIPAYSLVYHKSEIIIKSKQTFPEALNFSI